MYNRKLICFETNFFFKITSNFAVPILRTLVIAANSYVNFKINFNFCIFFHIRISLKILLSFFLWNSDFQQSTFNNLICLKPIYQLIKCKPIRFGYKLWAMCRKNGYCYNFPYMETKLIQRLSNLSIEEASCIRNALDYSKSNTTCSIFLSSWLIIDVMHWL